MIKPILSLDFDGVLHRYSSGWQGHAIISDRPTDGAMEFLKEVTEHFDVHICSVRSNYEDGRAAMRRWLTVCLINTFGEDIAIDILSHVEFPSGKPSASVIIDDRAIQFQGTWPTVGELKAFTPWTKKVKKYVDR
jgi:hypothetical protein